MRQEPPPVAYHLRYAVLRDSQLEVGDVVSGRILPLLIQDISARAVVPDMYRGVSSVLRKGRDAHSKVRRDAQLLRAEAQPRIRDGAFLLFSQNLEIEGVLQEIQHQILL